MNGRFLDSPDRRVRRASAAAYALATGLAVAAWSLLGGWGAVRDSDWLGAVALLVPSLIVWWVAAGVGLRIARWMDRDTHRLPR